MQINKEKLIKAINQLELNYQYKPGKKPRLFHADFKKSFISAILNHGFDCNGIITFMQKHNINVTKRVVYSYLRLLFGPYKKLGRPAVYVDNGNVRQTSKSLYLKNNGGKI